jgi:hypothetical protein
MSYIIDRVLTLPTQVAAPISSGDPANLWSSFTTLPAASLRDLVVYIHNPAGSGANVLVAFVPDNTATASYGLNSTEGLTMSIAPGDTLPIGIRVNAGEIFIAGDSAAVDAVVTIASVTGVQAC